MMLHRLIPDELPAEVGVMSFDQWTGSYRDTYNNIWVMKRHGRKLWELAERGPGNQTILHSRHRDVSVALAKANNLHANRTA